MNRFVAVLALTLFVFTGCAKPPTADEIVNRMVEAQGGAETVKAINDQVSVWTMEMTFPVGDSMVTQIADMVITCKKPNMIKMVNTSPDKSEVHSLACVGDSGWVQQNALDPVNMPEEQMQEFSVMAETWIDGWYDYASKNIKIEMLSDTTMNGTAYHRLKATDRFGNTSMNYVNTTTYFIDRAEAASYEPMAGVKIPTVMMLSDYKKHEGMMVPETVTQQGADGTTMWVAKLVSVKNNSSVSDEIFSRPAAAPKDKKGSGKGKKSAGGGKKKSL